MCSPELKARLCVRFHHIWDTALKMIQVCSNERSFPLSKGDNSFILNIHWRHALTISTKLGTEHPWVKGIKNLENEDFALLPRGGNSNKLKIYWKLVENIFSRTAGPISIIRATKYSWVKGIQFIFNLKVMHFSKGR